jgi:hypothetical protein
MWCTFCRDIRNTNVGALPATPIRNDMHNMQRFVAGQTSLHKGKHYRKRANVMANRADTQVCPYTDTRIWRLQNPPFAT